MAEARTPRQEQEEARTEVTEVGPNVLRMELPIRMPGLGHVNCYALLDDDGAAVVDPGLPGKASFEALRSRLSQAGLAVKDIHTVLVTHSHPDHFGGAAMIRKESGAEVIAHEAFTFGTDDQPEVSVDDLAAQEKHAHAHAHDRPEAIDPDDPSAQQAAEAAERIEALGKMRAGGRTPWGGERPRPPWRTRLRWMAMRVLGQGSWMPRVTKSVKEGDALRLAGREWFVVHTPGHTQDHFCLHNREDGLFLAGDHVLPTITPHISGLAVHADPLKQFYDSLDLVAALPDVDNALPAHGHPFGDLAGRCEAIKLHHDDRLERVKEIGREIGTATVQAFSHKLFKPRSWGSMAESETYAHLEHLRWLGEAERRDENDGYLYTI